MRKARWRLNRDLILVAALITAGLLVTALPLPDPLRAIVLVPLVLGAPGYAVAAALFPPGYVTGSERAVLTFALSVVVWTLGGVLMQLVIDLDLWGWLLMGSAVTLGALVIARWRRREHAMTERDSATSAPWRPAELTGLAARAALSGIALVAAGALTILALALGSASQDREMDRAHYSGVWISPSPPGSRPPDRISVGVENHEGTTGGFRLVVTTGGRTIDEWEAELESGERLEASVPAVEAEAAVVAAVYRDGLLERRVKLEYGALK